MENKIVSINKKDMVRGVVFDTDIYDHFEDGIDSILKDSYSNPTKDIKDYIYHTQMLADSEVYNYVIFRLNTIKYNIIYSIKSIIASLLKTNIESLNTDLNLVYECIGYNSNINTILKEYVETVITVKDKREVTERFVTAFYSYINVIYVADIYSNIMAAARTYIYSNPGNIDLFDENPINSSLDISYVYVHNIVSNLIHRKFEEYSNEFTAITEYIINAYSNIYVGNDQNNTVTQIDFDDF